MSKIEAKELARAIWLILEDNGIIDRKFVSDEVENYAFEQVVEYLENDERLDRS